MFLENLYPLALLSGLTGLIFFQALGFDFCVVDDSVYVTENSNVLKGLTYDSVLWALTSLHANFYHPATTLSHMLDVQIYGLTPWGPHLTNILLHTINAYILFLALVKLTGHFRTALLISALFAVHPLHVESVVWISQRKDLLSGLFFFLCLRAYAGYAKNPDLKKYLLVYALFLLALLSKPVVVTLPFVLLLLDFWPLNRLYPLKRVNSAGRQENPFRIFAEKVPFFFAVALFSLLAYVAQDRGGAIGGSTTYPLAIRLKNAIVSYVLYIK
ncbi:MAG: hypothetical protein ACE5FU_02405, partial [Nitrospinota bacterium]